MRNLTHEDVVPGALYTTHSHVIITVNGCVREPGVVYVVTEDHAKDITNNLWAFRLIQPAPSK